MSFYLWSSDSNIKRVEGRTLSTELLDGVRSSATVTLALFVKLPRLPHLCCHYFYVWFFLFYPSLFYFIQSMALFTVHSRWTSTYFRLRLRAPCENVWKSRKCKMPKMLKNWKIFRTSFEQSHLKKKKNLVRVGSDVSLWCRCCLRSRYRGVRRRSLSCWSVCQEPWRFFGQEN